MGEDQRRDRRVGRQLCGRKNIRNGDEILQAPRPSDFDGVPFNIASARLIVSITLINRIVQRGDGGLRGRTHPPGGSAPTSTTVNDGRRAREYERCREPGGRRRICAYPQGSALHTPPRAPMIGA